MSARAAVLQAKIQALSVELMAELAAQEAPPPAPKYLTIQGFAAYLCLSDKTVRRMIKAGMSCRWPRARAARIPVAEAEAWIAANPEKARAAKKGLDAVATAGLDMISEGVR